MNNDIPTVRLARESDRPDIARCIAEGFEKDFSLFSTDVNTVAEALAEGIHLPLFEELRTHPRKSVSFPLRVLYVISGKRSAAFAWSKSNYVERGRDAKPK